MNYIIFCRFYIEIEWNITRIKKKQKCIHRKCVSPMIFVFYVFIIVLHAHFALSVIFTFISIFWSDVNYIEWMEIWRESQYQKGTVVEKEQNLVVAKSYGRNTFHDTQVLYGTRNSAGNVPADLIWIFYTPPQCRRCRACRPVDA